MIKYLPVGLIVVVIIGGLLYFRFFQQSQTLSKPVVDQGISTVELQSEISNANTTEDRVRVLELAILDIAKQVGTLKTMVGIQSTSSPSSQVVTTTQSVIDLQAKVDGLQRQINIIKQSPAPVQNSYHVPVYIPLGSGGEPIGAISWSNAEGYRVTINSADYPGYSSIQLEIALSMPQLLGTENAQLFNLTDNVAVNNTQVSSTTTAGYISMSSGKGLLASGVKTYQLQVYQSQGYGISIRGARIKINF